MHRRSYYIINGITIYRLAASLLLLYLVLLKREDIFKWLLGLSFFTDAIDGFLARKYKVVSVAGARIDSIADDLTVLMAVIGVVVLKPEFIRQELNLIIVLLVLYLLQTIMALTRYGKISSFHTYLAKIAALFQGMFFVLLFFLPQWPMLLFYVASAMTILDLVEEIILVLLLPEWKTDVKGLYWIKKQSRKLK